MKYYIQNTEIYSVEYELGEGYNLSIDNSIEDFEAGKIVQLSDKQVAFYHLNPNASSLEILSCKLGQWVPSVSEVISHRIMAIEAYDSSSAVNGFSLNGVDMWLDRDTRTSLMNTVNAYRLAGIPEITLWTTSVNPISVTLTLDKLTELLVALELYAKECYDVKSQHKTSVQDLTTVEDLMIYNFKEGYPKKLSYTL